MRDGADEAKRTARILDVLAGYDIEAKPQGRQYMARCPFHEDHTPSLSVDPIKNVWHCFGCDKGGSVIDFVMLKEGLPFREAVDRLLVDGRRIRRGFAPAGRSAMTALISLGGTSKAAEGPEAATAPAPVVPTAKARPEPACPESDRRVERAKSHGVDPKLIDSVIEHYHRTLAGPDTRGLDYLRRRCLADPETLKTFRVGYVNGSLLELLPASAVEPMKQVGILRKDGSEFFSGCIVVPIFCAGGASASGGTATGELGEMYGRSIEGSRHLYLPGPHRGVMNAKAAEVFDELILTEAVLDALSLYAIGVKNVIPCYGTGGYLGSPKGAQSAVALCEGGTASADSDTHHGLLLKHKTKRIFLAFDNDEAGENGAKKLAATLSASGAECRRVRLPDGDGQVKDLNDYVRRLRGQGMKDEEIRAGFAELMKHAPRLGFRRAGGGRAGGLSLVEQTESALVFQNCDALYHLRGLFDNNASSLRVILSATRHSTPDTSSHTDRLDLYTAKHRTSFAYRAANRLELPAAKIEEDLNRLIPLLETLLSENRSRAEQSSPRHEMTGEERSHAHALLRDPLLLDRIAADLETLGYAGEERNKQLAYVIATSRKLSKPLSAIVRSQSGAGKSYLMECVAELMPPEDVQYFSRLTPQSLYYMGKDELVHKLLIVDERDGSAEAEYPIRTLQTRRKLTLAVPIKDPSTGKIQTKQIEILGPIAYMESTTSARLNPENANRNFEIFLDESDEQTRRIYAAQQKAHTLEGWREQRRREEVARLHHNAQRLLKPVRVLIPFTGRIRFPVAWTRGRRDHDRLLCLIEAIAFLHQCQRPEKTGEGGSYIEATAEDYALAYDLARTAFAHALTDMPREARLLLSQIRAMVKEWSERLGVDEKDYGFRRRDVREYTKQPDHQVKRALRMLEDLEYLQVKRAGRGGSFVYHLARTPADRDPLDGLTTPEELRRALKESDPRS